MNGVRAERVSQTLASSSIDAPHSVPHREIPRDTARALRELSCDIACYAQPSHASRLFAAIDARVGELPAELGELLASPGNPGAAVLSGLQVDEQALGPTPSDWSRAGTCPLAFEVAMLLLGRCAGEPFGWQGQQNGRLVNNIVPTAGHEDEQTGAGSATLLCPHTEDAFHPRRANILLLGCLRNPDRVGTTVSSIRSVQLTPEEHQLLSTPTLPILPDVSYGDMSVEAAGPVPTLWAGPEGQTLRYDPAYTPLDQASNEFRAAYNHLSAELERVCVTVALAPGELLLVDNDVAVHGRAPFTARYDGTDRWLKRINIRLPHRPRNAAESDENGYGQQLVEPFAPWATQVTETPEQSPQMARGL